MASFAPTNRQVRSKRVGIAAPEFKHNKWIDESLKEEMAHINELAVIF
jgi:hypothetical protein